MAIYHLLGVPARPFFNKELKYPDDLWPKITNAFQRNQSILAGTNDNNDTETSGIVSGHAYSVISAHEFMHKGKRVRLLKMRNPWGFGEWKGDWSDESSLWTDDLKS
jgi:hypothetical protein